MWDTYLDNAEHGTYGICNTSTGIFIPMYETMGVAQMYANSYNRRDGYIPPHTSIYEFTEADDILIGEKS